MHPHSSQRPTNPARPQRTRPYPAPGAVAPAPCAPPLPLPTLRVRRLPRRAPARPAWRRRAGRALAGALLGALLVLGWAGGRMVGAMLAAPGRYGRPAQLAPASMPSVGGQGAAWPHGRLPPV